MALVNMGEMLARAREGRYAVANFDISSSTLLQGALEAARSMDAPVILAWAEPFAPVVPLETFGPMLIAEAERAGVRVCIHLDHARSVDLVRRVLDVGFTSAMFDGSDLPLEENIRLSREAADACHRAGATFEGEIGHVGGLPGYEYEGDPYTKVADAVKYVAETGADALAVGIGTIHGVYQEAPRLNLDRLEALREALSVPLVLHGGSGLSDEDFRSAIRLGISKINVYTDLAQAVLQAVTGQEGALLDREILAVDAVADRAKSYIDLFGSSRRSL